MQEVPEFPFCVLHNGGRGVKPMEGNEPHSPPLPAQKPETLSCLGGSCHSCFYVCVSGWGYGLNALSETSPSTVRLAQGTCWVGYSWGLRSVQVSCCCCVCCQAGRYRWAWVVVKAIQGTWAGIHTIHGVG